MPPIVSIVLPAFNAAPTIARAVKSLRAQTLRDWQLIVVDDGSTDDTAATATAAAGGDHRIDVLRGPHAGIVAALNRGLAAATAPLIARMDADDESEPARLAQQVEYLHRHPTIGLVGCLVDYGGDVTQNAGYALHVAWINSLVSAESIALNRFVESPFAHPSVMFRRELLDRHGGYREGEFPEDYELWLRWLEAGVHMAKVPERLLVWHDSPARLSRQHSRYAPDAFFRIKAGFVAREVLRTHAGRDVFVWGAGRPTRKRAAHLHSGGLAITGYIDIDPKKTGRSVGGLPVVAPTKLPGPSASFVLGYVATRGARDLIRTHLATVGYVEGRDFLMCA